jgi:AGCS family alanine or glycine:cation symporter
MNSFYKLFVMAAAFFSLAAPASAQEAAMSLDAKVNAAFASFTSPFVNFIFAPIPGTAFPWIVMWLVVGATVFTIYFAFVQFRYFGHAISLVKGDYSDPNDAGEVSHFQALRRRRSCRWHRWARCDILDDPRGPFGHGFQIHRMYTWCEIPQRIP